MDKLNLINEALKDIMGIDPLVPFADPKNEMNYEENYALAQMYSTKGFRSYMEKMINNAITNAALRTTDLSDVYFSKARILTLKELLVQSKRAFDELNKIEAKAERLYASNK